MTDCSIRVGEQFSLVCLHCKKVYSDQNPPRTLPICGHTLCHNCIKVLIAKKRTQQFRLICPFDQFSYDLATNSPTYFQRNLTLCEQVRKVRRTSITTTTNEFMLSVRDGNMDSIKMDGEEVCMQHNKTLDIVCMLQKMKICAECALFGHHKGHHFLTVKDFERLKHTHCQAILAVIEGKTLIENKIRNQGIKKDIMHLLQEKKMQIIKQAQKNFELLVKEVEAASEQFRLLIEVATKECRGRLERLCAVNPKINARYQEWEKRALQQVKIIQGKKFHQCVELFNNKQKMSILLVNGDKILKCLKKQQQSMMSKVQTIINDLKINAQNSIKEQIKHYLELQTPTGQVHEECESVDDYNEYQQKKKEEEKENKQQNRSKMSQSFCRPTVRSSINDMKVRPRMMSSMNKSIILTKKQFDDISIKPKAEKRKFPNVKDPDRYEKNIIGMEKDALQIVDFNNSELGDNVMLGVIEVIKKTQNVKCIRLVKNKLTDQIGKELIILLRRVNTLILCQNLLTDQFVDEIIRSAQREPFEQVKSLYLGGNLMNPKRMKVKMEEMKALNIHVTL